MDYKIIRSGRKTLSVEISRDLKITVRAPYFVSDSSIKSFVNAKFDLIEKHINKISKMNESITASTESVTLSNEEKSNLRNDASVRILKKVQHFSSVIGVDYGRISYKFTVSRWGSCSKNGNLNFNCLLVLCPDCVIDYVVIHELCHRKEMNHSKAFWANVEYFCPDYKLQKEWLKINGDAILKRIKA